ncbi:MAG: fumarylacetoacetate hydrolase family protein [Acidaminococcaceae bacterium]
MKLVNFIVGDNIRLGIKVEKGILDLTKAAVDFGFFIPETMQDLISGGQDILGKINELINQERCIVPEKEVVFAPCITNPEKIICVGLNYLDHANESKMEIPLSPVIFSKFNNALAAHNQEILLPRGAEQFDYEAELVIIIGKTAENISRDNALSHIFGYTIGNDLSARDLQFRTGQWLLGKTCDGFAPIGPYLVTADELNPSDLEICCRVNGELRQKGNTKNMIFDCSYIVSYLSQYMKLKPGDLIFTGTPAGVILGYPEEKRKWLKSGDEVVVSIDKIGSLKNKLK